MSADKAPPAAIGAVRIRLAGGTRADGVRLAHEVASRLAASGTAGWGAQPLARVRVAGHRQGAPDANTIADAIARALKLQGGGDA